MLKFIKSGGQTAELKPGARRLALAAVAALLVAAAIGLATASSAGAAKCLDCDGGGGFPGDDTTLPAPPTTPPPPDTRPRHVEVKLVQVHATDTEDIFGGDEFYLLGAVAADGVTAPVATTPVPIAAGETKALDQTIFSGNIAASSQLNVSLDAFDQDAGKVFEHLPEVLTAIGAGCTVGGWLDPQSQIWQSCNSYLPWASAIAGLLAPLNVDPDDKLGDSGSTVWPVTLPLGQPVTLGETYVGQNVPWWSDWAYDITYQVTVTLA
jgi:hypothetical protein